MSKSTAPIRKVYHLEIHCLDRHAQPGRRSWQATIREHGVDQPILYATRIYTETADGPDAKHQAALDAQDFRHLIQTCRGGL
jgi:hypothetical protein